MIDIDDRLDFKYPYDHPALNLLVYFVVKTNFYVHTQVKFLIKLNFYQFQIRESKKQKIIELREKFEADKKKVERMKQDRKFKPMTA